ncbi:MAG: hypothetical protein GF320_03995 [Armatimonadia bacterium]|nr:hypothetical protein [Armatimonadia bacterium]
MGAEDRLRGALSNLARGASGSRVLVRRITSRQERLGESAAELATVHGLGESTALTPGTAGFAHYFMVGKDGLDDATVVLG